LILKLAYESGHRYLAVQFGDEDAVTHCATSETGSAVRDSTTWNFEGPDGRKYRVQIQVGKEVNNGTERQRDTTHRAR
jgi:hypothetical protein